MVTMLYILTLFFTLGGMVLLWRERKSKVQSRRLLIEGMGQEDEIDDPLENKRSSLMERLVQPKWKQFKRSFRRSMPDQKQEKMELKLLRAGNPMGMTPFEYRVGQLVLFVAFPMLGFLLAWLGNLSFGRTFLIVLLMAGLAAYLPYVYLKMKAAKRSTQAVRELPDFIDLMAVSMEAGLGFDSALSKVVSKQSGVLSEEFQRCLEELKLGKTRKEALSGVRERVQVDDVKLLIGSIIQAEQLGVGMVQILRVQSEEVRQRRKQRAEEEAMKAPIKMLFPLVIFIFPCIFVVLLGPAVIQIMDVFSQ
ncbi:pilus assembly protein TadC [Halalkalibacillus sediminis]|uniref:Pilus assembly protein TadC n=1 Tax=Halalkalibacillus sediminis TaxID=2018042 RepID=A0A2I0QSF3_9BACI|nr:type II secretion system F family protein [Halalkalibacillus sediminis]PKR77263.1 pilus assembly protein TadC [Halalkalibacillus sediminis]